MVSNRLKLYAALIAFIVACVLVIPARALTYIPVEEISGPTCVVLDTVTGISLPLSPEISQYNVIVTDGFAHIRCTQMYVNRFQFVNDIVYIFPLPHEGSVHAMSMEYNGMIYKAEIYEKQQAQQIYDSIKAIGGIAALLLQDKPNVFQQRLANIAYNDTAFVRIEISMPLTYNNGQFELALPTMVAPRFGGEEGMPQLNANPWNPPANIEGQRLFITTLIQTGYPISNVTSPTHPLIVQAFDAARPVLEKQGVIDSSSTCAMQYNTAAYLKNEVTYPNSDYVLRFSRSESTQDFSLASYFSASLDEGYFALQMYPGDSLFNASERPPLEVIMMIDVSGSQDGWPLAKEKEIAANILARLNPSDRFGVLSFSDSHEWLFPGMIVDAASQNISSAHTYIQGLQVIGGTELLSAINEVLAVPKSTEHERIFIFLTDGQIGNEEAIFSTIQNHPSNPTIFTFGAGDNLNRYFLDRSAEIGNGFSTVITQTEDVAFAVGNAWQKIESPQIDHISFDFGGLDTVDMVLPASNHLFAGSPIELYGRYASGGSKTIRITGYRDGQPIEFSKTIELAQDANTNIMVPKIWAKQLIDKLSLEEGTTTANKTRIIGISTTYQVLSKYTAFLAIQGVPVEDGGSIGEDLIHATPVAADKTATVTSLSITCDGQYLQIAIPENLLLKEFAVYDMRGRLLFRMNPGRLAGTKFVRWDGMLDSGKRLLPGRYVVRLMFEGKTVAKTIFWK